MSTSSTTTTTPRHLMLFCLSPRFFFVKLLCVGSTDIFFIYYNIVQLFLWEYCTLVRKITILAFDFCCELKKNLLLLTFPPFVLVRSSYESGLMIFFSVVQGFFSSNIVWITSNLKLSRKPKKFNFNQIWVILIVRSIWQTHAHKNLIIV